MRNTSKAQDFKFQAGERIVGKWHHHEYTILSVLGAGATGTVYLAQHKSGKVALKVGFETPSIISEVNVLKHFAKVQGTVLGPSLIDVDDHVADGTIIPFYVMEYLDGVSLFSFMKQHQQEWLSVFFLQLLSDLQLLHQAGWVFGDLKPDNVLIVGPPYRIRWLDVGGTTQIGRSIKEYTEFFDRGYWGLGSRVAEPSYDLFACCMIMVNIAYPKRFEKLKAGNDQLKEAVMHSPLLAPYAPVIKKGLYGNYASAEAMKQELLSLLHKKKHVMPQQQAKTTVASSRIQHKKQSRHNKRGVAFELLLLGTFFLVVYFFYLWSQSM
ncbi:serine/threonine protein kinase [Fictibacillus macauensis ZFHKF-1]|uniref:Serine/threonine protein kinase n=1 Tax=Fictibacillus macauensis ZFHKF-1 TaxID=1196324 RepID=I8UB54_9BACL|nr:phosphotransferase [Fictibacillus macauensis]EIT84170.1 serine/threonine protein kinase [Fictibacillus macauensis ZFHKF-1]